MKALIAVADDANRPFVPQKPRLKVTIPMARIGKQLPPAQRLLQVLLAVVLVLGSSFAPGPLSQAQNLRFTSALQFREVAPGIEYGQISAGRATSDEATGPWFINLLRLDLSKARVKVVRALDVGLGMETLSSLSLRHGATAGVNGGYFRTTGTYRGEPLGFLLLEGNLLSEPHNNRVEVGFINRGNRTEVVFGHLRFTGQLSLAGFTHAVAGLNRPVAANELVVFTPEFHLTTLTNPGGLEIVVQRNRIVAISESGSTRIPTNGFVVSASGTARDWLKQHGRRGAVAKFSWDVISLKPADNMKWKRAYSIIGGGPQLISGGKLTNTKAQEKITEAFASDRHPRTAVALLSSGRLLLATVDGRQPGVSVGMSLNTLSDLLLELGAIEAINLDGGGSTTMVVENKMVNRPSDSTGERPISDAILVFPKKNR